MKRARLLIPLAAAVAVLAGCNRQAPPPVTVAPRPSAAPPGAASPAAAPVAKAPADAPAASAPVPAPADTPGLSRLGELNLLVGEYISQTGQVPKSFEEMVVKKFIASVPQAPQGKRYQIKVLDQSRAEVVLVNN